MDYCNYMTTPLSNFEITDEYCPRPRVFQYGEFCTMRHNLERAISIWLFIVETLSPIPPRRVSEKINDTTAQEYIFINRLKLNIINVIESVKAHFFGRTIWLRQDRRGGKLEDFENNSYVQP